MRKSRILVFLVLAVALLLPSSMVFAAGQQEGGEVTINIALANNPISQALARIAQEEYEAEGVTVNISVLPENDLRQRLTTEASTGGTTYDMFYVGPYEAQTWAKNGWLENLEPYFDSLSAEEKECPSRGWSDAEEAQQLPAQQNRCCSQDSSTRQCPAFPPAADRCRCIRWL